jgi:hypothetical protein
MDRKSRAIILTFSECVNALQAKCVKADKYIPRLSWKSTISGFKINYFDKVPTSREIIPGDAIRMIVSTHDSYSYAQRSKKFNKFLKEFDLPVDTQCVKLHMGPFVIRHVYDESGSVHFEGSSITYGPLWSGKKHVSDICTMEFIRIVSGIYADYTFPIAYE